MSNKPIVITEEMFAETKKRNDHHWQFLGQQKGGGRKDPNKKILCRCELCNDERWVMWRTLKEGTSKRCNGCSRKLTPKRIAELNTRFEHDGVVWKLTGECMSTGARFRSYRAICGGCNRDRWVDLGSLVRLHSHSCASCGQRKRMTGSYVPKVKNRPVIRIKDESLPIGIATVA